MLPPATMKPEVRDSFGCVSPLILAAWVLFVVSFFLPACESMRGFVCACTCACMIRDVCDIQNAHNLSGVTYFVVTYYALFTLPNLTMLLSPLVLLRRKQVPAWTTVVATSCSLYVLSWGVFCWCADWGSGLRIGYYLWAASFLSFLGGAIHLRKQQVGKKPHAFGLPPTQDWRGANAEGPCGGPPSAAGKGTCFLT